MDAFIGLDQVRELGTIVERVLQQRPTLNAQRSRSNAESWGLNVDSDANQPALNFVTPRPTYIPDYDTPRFRLHSAALRLLEDSRGLQSSLQFLRYPANARAPSQPHAGISSDRDSRPGDRGRALRLVSSARILPTTEWICEKKPARVSRSIPLAGSTLAGLLREIEKIEGDFWIRLLYTHPAHWSDELIATIAECRHVARYIDIPLQHIDESMLLRMRRETTRAHIEDLIAKLRAGIPGVALRTTFIVGFPGETEVEFETLLDFLDRTRFERLRDFQIFAGGRIARS